MPRRPRLLIPDQPHHVIQRGNNRQTIFSQRADYLFYLQTLKQACLKYHSQLHAYVLMTNHVHLLITPNSESGISVLMQYVGRIYVRYFNDLYKRTGTLFEARFKSTVIDSERYLLICYCYIELNPVRASMVQKAEEYPYSSFACNAQGIDDDLIKPHFLYLELGNNQTQRLENYQAIIQNGLTIKTTNFIRDSSNKSITLTP